MLGVRRASISIVSQKLRQAGIINYSRGQIKILDRFGLEEISCECYRVVRARLAEIEIDWQ